MKNNCKKCYEENKTPNIEDCNYCNMPKKYVIQNCPAHFNNVQMLEFSEGDCNSDKVTKAYCKDITDCVMKRIVERADICLCPEVVELLEIEEVDENSLV